VQILAFGPALAKRLSDVCCSIEQWQFRAVAGPRLEGGRLRVKHGPLVIASLVSALLMTMHFADDIVRGMENGGLANLVIVPVLVLQLYAALVATERRWGHVILLLVSLMEGIVVPVVHFKVTGGVAGHGIATSSGGFLFVWTLVALGASATFAFVLSIRALWHDFRPLSTEGKNRG
jgi:hypothetical protein